MEHKIKRPEVVYQVISDREEKDKSRLAFQLINWSKYPEPYYTFVWIKGDGKLSSRGRVRIPDVSIMLDLIMKAKEEGWLSLVDKNIKWSISYENMED